MEQKTKKLKWGRLIGVSFNILVLLACLLLIRQNRDLKHQLALTSLGNIGSLKTGERAEPFKMTLLDGTTSEFGFADSSMKYLFYILSTTCPHCEKTLPIWNSIASKKIVNLDVVGLSMGELDEARKFLETNQVGFYLVSTENDPNFRRKYKVSGVPVTLLIKGNGTVERVWAGELSSDQEGEIENLIGSNKSASLY